MRITKHTIDLVLGQLAYFEKLYGAVSLNDEGRYSISSEAALDIIRDASEIVDTCDTLPLPAALTDAASAIGDGAYLLIKSLEAAQEVKIANQDIEEDSDGVQHFFKKKKQQTHFNRLLDTQAYLDAGDYARKGRELLRAPARKANIEISSTLP